ncbi:Nucleoside 2-deoxyribosyltransferase [Cognatiyoonia koreensis]|uniref:Nucleoside 2-deoxyribosyltransferase n=1 Tax=Cognatiyoonia koreensis TaxID=364200 RepID=A0A1I0RTW8_9RHOB|nr:nucleoside 2-deoxyribosyltransferase [Cognatiyoonia koreensis]SEW44761.1 Nucleoside 2-deoxyribosyltransferase [Cognatiyoonia koreensis]
MNRSTDLLLMGEVFVDFTLPNASAQSKLRLGGIVHAARGLWAVDQSFAAAVVCPAYLVDNARKYLEHLGCTEFIWVADVEGSPNVMAIGDPTEIADQGYQDILRDEKSVNFLEHSADIGKFKRCLLFPGKFDLPTVADLISDDAEVSFDIAYDLPETKPLVAFKGRIHALITSTSSSLFLENAATDVTCLINDLRQFSPTCILLKENRGGSRLFDLDSDTVEEIPALLGETVNSVGVGDVYSAVFVSLIDAGMRDAGWKAARAATCYAQTTFPDDFKRDVGRSLTLSVDQMHDLGGTFVPWHGRPKLQIYFAAPDFTYIDRNFIDQALEALAYHNFKVRRPVFENGELERDSTVDQMHTMFTADIALLKDCEIVFAVPLTRDPGTLVEMGWAMATDVPVITFDPLRENTNTMVVAGSKAYSDKLDICLNGLFEAMSSIRASRQ